MTLVIKMPYGCPQCQRSEGSGSFPEVSITLDEVVVDYSGTHYIKRGFACPSCGRGASQVIAFDDQSVFFKVEGERPYYCLKSCTTCGTERAYVRHECLADDYPDEYLLPGRCRACGRTDPLRGSLKLEREAAVLARTRAVVSVGCPSQGCANEVSLTCPAPGDYMEVTCSRCGGSVAIGSAGKLLPSIGMEFDTKVWKAASGSLTLPSKKFAERTYRPSMDDYTTVRWHDRIRVRVTSTDHAKRQLGVQLIEITSSQSD